MAVSYPARSRRWANVPVIRHGNYPDVQYIKSNKWSCEYCASFNLDGNLDCRNCGAPRTEPEGLLLVSNVEHHSSYISLAPGVDVAEFERRVRNEVTRALRNS